MNHIGPASNSIPVRSRHDTSPPIAHAGRSVLLGGAGEEAAVSGPVATHPTAEPELLMLIEPSVLWGFNHDS